MGSEVCADELMSEENPSKNPILFSKLRDGISHDMIESKNVLLSQFPNSTKNHGASIGPVTPDSIRENADPNYDSISPLPVLSPPPHAPCTYTSLSNSPDSSYGNGLETPKETLFDSFAPGPDKFMLAPQHQKCREESRNHVVRRLNFTCATNLAQDFCRESRVETSSDEERLFDIVYKTILDAIFLEQSELDTELMSQGLDMEGPRSPKSAWVFSGVAETCPEAPMKTSSKSRNIDREICRKLEF